MNNNLQKLKTHREIIKAILIYGQIMTLQEIIQKIHLASLFLES